MDYYRESVHNFFRFSKSKVILLLKYCKKGLFTETCEQTN